MAVTSTQALDIARRLNPITASPSSALETAALLDSFGYSLMPRTSSRSEGHGRWGWPP